MQDAIDRERKQTNLHHPERANNQELPTIKEVMASNLTFDEVAEENMIFQEDDDVFIAEEIGDSLGDQQVEQVMTLEPKKGLMFDSEDDVVRFYKGYAKRRALV
ncbi:protein FAR-RED IMPAIRED RESPONSE 1-like [Hordeum vulgare]|nr:protein FAR-RED IMPAIRED RESPONSE 1-like [Hordeum vulgare]